MTYASSGITLYPLAPLAHVNAIVVLVMAADIGEDFDITFLIIGANFSGFAIAFFRLRWMERHLDRQVFCQGTIIPDGSGTMPSAIVYARAEPGKEGDRGVRRPEMAESAQKTAAGV